MNATDNLPVFLRDASSLMTRRDVLRLTSLGLLGVLASSAFAETVAPSADKLQHFAGDDVFHRIVKKSKAENWNALPIGELIGKIAMELAGTPYVGFTLELSKDQQSCVVNLKALDCVTFFGDSLCMARMIKKGKSQPEDLLAEV